MAGLELEYGSRGTLGAEAAALISHRVLLGCSGGLVSRLSSGPSGLSDGFLWGLMGDTKWTY